MRKAHLAGEFRLIVGVPQFPPWVTYQATRDRCLQGQPAGIAFQSPAVPDDTDAVGTASDGACRPAHTVLSYLCRLASHRRAHPLAVAPASSSVWLCRVSPARVSADPPRQSDRRSATRENRPLIPALSHAVPGPAPARTGSGAAAGGRSPEHIGAAATRLRERTLAPERETRS